MNNQQQIIKHIRLMLSHPYLIDEVLNDYLEKNPIVKFNRNELIEICKEALKNAIFIYDPQKNGLFKTFATLIIVEALNDPCLSVNFLKLSKKKKKKKIINTYIGTESFYNQSISLCSRPNILPKLSYSNICEYRLNGYHLKSNTDEYKHKKKEGFLIVKNKPMSTFSINVDTASYGIIRKHILAGKLPNAESVRTEELINYFNYKYPQPENNEQIAVSCETGICPWQHKHQIAKIAIKAKEINSENLPASHLVFLIDVSGSMEGASRLELVKLSLIMLTDQLRDIDRISVVIFSNEVSVLINNERGENKEKIKDIIAKLYASGGTYGERAIQKAYKIAKTNFIENGNNRVVLCTDGDFNIGVNDEKGLEELIKEKAESNIFLSIFGYGMGNFKDNNVKTLALKGHGNYAYIDSLLEANHAMVKEYSGAMVAMAKDVKVQVEFNPAKVNAYRLIGYETSKLRHEDFNNDQKEAGVMGVGQKVTVMYEIVPVDVHLIDPLKYQKDETISHKTFSEELMTVKVRYKMPEENISKKIELPINENNHGEVSSDFRFASSVAMFGQILTNSEYIGVADFANVIELAKSTVNEDESGHRHEFVSLVELAVSLSKY